MAPLYVVMGNPGDNYGRTEDGIGKGNSVRVKQAYRNLIASEGRAG